MSTFGGGFFEFGYTDQSEISEVGTLTIEDCEFVNFYYDFTSFILLNNGHGHVEISGSKFDKFSNCGSIIRDTREFPKLDYEFADSMDTSELLSFRSSTQSIDVTQDKFYMEISTN